MSVPTDNLARIRDNQRRSRARRKEYLQELEQRLRAYELQGIEASTEVQMAARKVAEENRQLRDLLNRCGVGDDQIAHYLQTGSVPAVDSTQGLQSFRAGDPGAAMQSLQQLMPPRPAASLEPSAPYPLPSPSSRETSTASGFTASSSVWEASPSALTPYGLQQQVGVGPGVMGSSVHGPYAGPVYGGARPARAARLRAVAGVVAGPAMSLDGRPAVSYHSLLDAALPRPGRARLRRSAGRRLLTGAAGARALRERAPRRRMRTPGDGHEAGPRRRSSGPTAWTQPLPWRRPAARWARRAGGRRTRSCPEFYAVYSVLCLGLDGLHRRPAAAEGASPWPGPLIRAR